MKLESSLAYLKTNGCFPSVHRRGDLWRAHVNTAGNFWADAETPEKALDAAIELWVAKGKPMDGLADNS